MENILILITVCLIISMGLSELFHRMHYPKVIGQILAGVILSIPFIKELLLIGRSMDIIAVLAEFGIIFLLFLTGLQINVEHLKKNSKKEFIIAVLGAGVPFILGLILMKLLGYSTQTGIVVGACLSITAPGTTLKLLMELKKIRTNISEMLIGAAIIDDILVVVFLAMISFMIGSPSKEKFILLPIEIILFVVIIFIIFKIIPPLMDSIVKKRSEVAEFTTAIVIALLITALSIKIGLGPILGAFIAGVIIQMSFTDKREENKIVNHLSLLTFGLIIPFFFIHLGINFNFGSIINYPVMTLLIIGVAVMGKMLGGLASMLFAKIKLAQATLVGWGMNSRGAIELAIAEFARVNNLIPIEVYSAIIIMAVVTTMIFPIVLQHKLKKNPKILNA